MLAPQSGQIRLRIAEIKLELVFVTTASEAIMSLPVVAVLHRRMHNLKRGAARAFWVGRLIGYGLRPRVRYRHEEQLSRQTPAVMNGKAESATASASLGMASPSRIRQCQSDCFEVPAGI